MAHKAKNGLTDMERRELRLMRKNLVDSGMPAEMVKRKLIYYRKLILESREKEH
jgi:hypothetical protein